MSTNPDVSVVMSVYNGASQLRATLDSILSQEGVELELIVVNDGSTDKTSEILDDYAQRDPRVRVIYQENAGLTRALIRGCDAARGEFIARQDAGDISLPGRLKSQVTVLKEREDCVFVSCWTDVVGPKGEFLYTSRGTGVAAKPINIVSPKTNRGVLDGPSSHPSVTFRRKQYDLCGGYRPEFYFGQDWDLWYRLANLGTFCMIEKSLCVCNIAPNSISGSRKREQDKFAQLSLRAFLMRQSGLSDQPVLEEARLLSRSIEKPTNERRMRAAANYFIGKCLLDNGNEEALEYLLATVKQYPLHIKGWICLARLLFTSVSVALKR